MSQIVALGNIFRRLLMVPLNNHRDLLVFRFELLPIVSQSAVIGCCYKHGCYWVGHPRTSCKVTKLGRTASQISRDL